MTIRMTMVLLTVICFAIMSPVAMAEKETPWPLRDHYSFTGKSIVFKVDPFQAQWMAASLDGTEIMKSSYVEIVLGDGRRFKLSKDNWITDGRDSFEDGFGKGMRFRSEFKPVDGLHVEYHINRYDEQSFMTIMVIVRNTSTKPLALSAIRCEGRVLVDDPELLIIDNSVRRGIHLVPSGTQHASLVELHSSVSEGIIGIGLLQSGFMQSSLQLEQDDGGWVGSIDSTFTPPIELAPGATAQSDALWVMFSAEDSEMLHDLHGWVTGFTMPETTPKNYPKAWVTVPSSSTSANLLDSVGKKRAKAVNHVLVPAGWPAGSDTMGLAQLASALRRKNMVPGLTVDPLLVTSKSKGKTLEGPEGRHWIDLRTSDGREYAVKQLRKIVNWKYGFFAVGYSEIPDSVLKELNITRSVADIVAFELMEEAAGILPVVPTSQLSLGNDVEAWNAVARATRAHRTFLVKTGPARLNVDGIDSLSPDVVDDLKTFAGPLEIVGVPSKKVRQQLDAIVTAAASE
ncbi:MAG: hypothetical protein VCD00_07850 [Candidatus Hydrogenedentota bacterium]